MMSEVRIQLIQKVLDCKGQRGYYNTVHVTGKNRILKPYSLFHINILN